MEHRALFKMSFFYFGIALLFAVAAVWVEPGFFAPVSVALSFMGALGIGVARAIKGIEHRLDLLEQRKASDGGN